MSIYKKLHNIQSKIKGLSKDKKSHNYDYVTGNKLLSFIKPLMDKEGLLLKQEVLSIENTRQDYATKYNEKSEILSKVMMRFTWVDVETGEKDENLFGANGQNDWEKGLGSALTYAERYFLLKYFHIATDEDDIDNPDRKKDNNTSSSKPFIEVNSKNWLAALNGGYASDIVKKKYNFKSNEDEMLYNTTLKEQKRVINHIENAKDLDTLLQVEDALNEHTNAIFKEKLKELQKN